MEFVKFGRVGLRWVGAGVGSGIWELREGVRIYSMLLRQRQLLQKKLMEVGVKQHS